MATFYCFECGERMCNSSDMSTFDHFLIKQNIYNLKQKKYDRIVKRVNDEYKEQQKDPEFSKNYEEIDTWLDICLELGQWAWICPKCKTLYVFEQNGNAVERVYKLDENWKKKLKEK